MTKTKKYLVAPLIIILILAGLFWTANPWIWLAIAVISAILPGASNRMKWHFFKYFGIALIAMGIYFIVAPPDKEVVQAMGKLLPVGGSGYVIVVFVVSAMVFAFIALTVRSFYQRIISSRD